MAYIERDNLEALLTKLNNTCEENDLVYKFESGRYPVRILIGPDQSMEAQMSMLDQDVGHNGKDATICFVFADGKLTYKISDGFVVNEALFNKLKNLAKKIHAAWLWVYFRESLDHARQEEMAAAGQEAAEERTEDDKEALDAAFAAGDEVLEDLAELAEAGDAEGSEE
ncbi:hypothetical protein [Allofournierella sp.]|mgnify:CR=1 FL=1|uniref:hypothetical protein n=1 Tax=Allofournierella sp. TaxID=1940256 RepID=UPI003AB3A6B9